MTHFQDTVLASGSGSAFKGGMFGENPGQPWNRNTRTTYGVAYYQASGQTYLERPTFLRNDIPAGAEKEDVLWAPFSNTGAINNHTWTFNVWLRFGLVWVGIVAYLENA